MFHRLLLEDWQRSLSLLGWFLFAMVFVLSALRTVCLSRLHIDRMQNLPLETEQEGRHE